MKRIEELDKNFAPLPVEYEGMTVYDITKEPFQLCGLRQPKQGTFERMPQDIADTVNSRVKDLNKHTSGGRIRFKTDSAQIIVSAVLPSVGQMSHMPQTGTSCFDLYVDGRYVAVFIPDFHKENETKRYEARLDLPGDKGMKDVLIYFPLYNEVQNVYIALNEGANVAPSDEYPNSKPVVFYGSSITQGACASHPGNCYASMVSRALNFDYINLGFAAGCLAEPIMADYISSLDMDILVYDYDHNAGNIDLFERTHETFFKTIREKQPNLPIIIISAAHRFLGFNENRRKIIKRTYENAIQSGDKNVYFIDGQDIYKEVGIDLCTVDVIHPNDIGFLCMAKHISAVIEQIYKLRG